MNRVNGAVKAVFLDMDGVVLDSEIVRIRYFKEFLCGYGLDVPREALSDLAGLGTRDAACEMASRYRLPLSGEACQEELVAFSGRLYLEAEDLRPYSGLREFLGGARRCGLRTGLVSSTCSYEVVCALNRFSLVSLFDVIVGGDAVDRRKPSPDPYLCAAAFVGASPAHCMVVEDSPVGIASGKAAGMYVAGLTAGSVVQDVSGADARAKDFAELEGILDNWLAERC